MISSGMNIPRKLPKTELKVRNTRTAQTGKNREHRIPARIAIRIFGRSPSLILRMEHYLIRLPRMLRETSLTMVLVADLVAF